MSPGSCRVCQDSARQSPDGYSDVSHIISAQLGGPEAFDVTLRYVSLRFVTFVTFRFVSFRYVTLRFVTLSLVTYRAGRPTSGLHHEDAQREDGYSPACWLWALGQAGQWTQHNVYSNRPSVRRHRCKGGQRASRRQEAAYHRSARAGGITAFRTTLRLALAARDRELRVERARSDTLAAQHVTAASGGPAFSAA